MFRHTFCCCQTTVSGERERLRETELEDKCGLEGIQFRKTINIMQRCVLVFMEGELN
jgi:hypothetical protein